MHTDQMSIKEDSRELLDELKRNYKLSRSQSVIWFRWTLTTALTGFLLVATSAILALAQQTAPAVVISMAGIISDSLAFVFFKQLKTVNQRQDKYHRDLIKRQQILDAIHLVHLISKQSDRDKIAEAIIKQSLHKR
jgi:hypothetical protein